jgi:DNA-binding transcriptional regulator YiaG
MKTKIEPLFLYEGLGFPIQLEYVEMIHINDEWLPKIDVQQVADEAIKKLAKQECRLTGNQVKFIRSYFSTPLRAFGETVVHESHTAVRKWESKGDEITNMNENTEMILRVFIIERTQTKNKAQQAAFYRNVQESKIFFANQDKKSNSHLNFQ